MDAETFLTIKYIIWTLFNCERLQLWEIAFVQLQRCLRKKIKMKMNNLLNPGITLFFKYNLIQYHCLQQRLKMSLTILNANRSSSNKFFCTQFSILLVLLTWSRQLFVLIYNFFLKNLLEKNNIFEIKKCT